MASKAPMSKWNKNALVSLELILKNNVNPDQLIDLLEEPAGGFMTEAEKMSVCEQPNQREKVGRIVTLLRGKGDQDFDIFIKLLRETGNEVWAGQLKDKAGQLKEREEQLVETPVPLEERVVQLEQSMELLQQSMEQQQQTMEQLRKEKQEAQSPKDSEYDIRLKVLLLGESGVGKSSLMLRFTCNEFSPEIGATTGMGIESRIMEIDSKVVKAEIWDTAGQERYKALMPTYYRNADGAILVYDITKHSTYSKVEGWLRELKHCNPDPRIAIMLVGNKYDLREDQDVTTEEARRYSHENSMLYFETSALDGTNVDDAFYGFVTEIFQSRQLSTYSRRSSYSHMNTVTVGQSPRARWRRKCC